MIDFMKAIADRITGKAPPGARRSTNWPLVRTAHLKDHPACSICETKTNLEVHHIIPFHVAPDLELEPENLITLCQNKRYGINCHLLVGHLGNWRRVNPDVASDVLEWNRKIKG